MIFKKITSVKILILTAFAVSVQSCFVAKTYKRPHLEEIQDLYRTAHVPTDSSSMAQIPWRSVFTDSHLVGYIEKGLENNIDIRVAMQRVLAAKAYVKKAKSNYFPTLTGTGKTEKQRSHESEKLGKATEPKRSRANSTEQFTLLGLLSWEADIWGKIRSSQRARIASYLQSVAAQKAVQTQLIADIALAYYRLLALDAQLKVTQKKLAFRRKSQAVIQALRDAGKANGVAVDQYAAQVYQTQSLLVDLKAQIFETENALAMLLGETPRHFERSDLKDVHIDVDTGLGSAALLLRNRPDVMAAEHQLVHDFELTNVARSNLYPSFNLNASLNLSTNIDEWFDTSRLLSILTKSITHPILNQRAIKTRYEVARIKRQEALLHFKKTLIQAGREVSDALYAYYAETEKLAYRRKEVAALRQAESESAALVDSGLANYLDLLTAGQSALKAELDFINDQSQQLSAVVSLYHALGGGWNAKPEQSASGDTQEAETE